MNLKTIGFLGFLVVLAVAGLYWVQGDFKTALAAGNNGRIMFGMALNEPLDYAAYVMDPDGQNLTRISEESSLDIFPVQSPDGSAIAFTAQVEGAFWLMVADGNGDNRQQLAQVSSLPTPQWSADGSKVAYIDTNSLWVVNADGSDLQELVSSEDLWMVGFDWAPDGQTIAAYTGTTTPYGLYAIDVDTGNSTQLDSLPKLPSLDSPAWSADGTIIAYGAQSADYPGPDSTEEIYLIRADGSNKTTVGSISSTLGFKRSYAWSPLENRLAFFVSSAGSNSYYTVMANGDELTELYSWEGATKSVHSIQWSPDGQLLLLKARLDKVVSDFSELELYTISAVDGSGVARLTDNNFEEQSPSWQSLGATNQAPVAIDDILTVDYQTAGVAMVLANDSDDQALQGSGLTITVQPQHGLATVNQANGSISYTPDTGYSGADQLTYQICDADVSPLCDTAILKITVQNQAGPGPTPTPTPTPGGSGNQAPEVAVTLVQGQPAGVGKMVKTSNTTPTFSGTATPGATITVLIQSDPITLTTIADGSGYWSVSPTQPLPLGKHTVTISASLDGQTTVLGSFSLEVEGDDLPETGVSMGLLKGIGGLLLLVGVGVQGVRLYRRVV